MFYRHFRAIITAAPNPRVSVWVQYGGNTVQLVSNVALPPISKTQVLRLVLTSSTGGSNNYHGKQEGV